MLFFVMQSAVLFAQDTFRRDYSSYCYFDPDTGQWSEWREGGNTMVFNINDNADMVLYKANGEKERFRSVSKVSKDVNANGDAYQVVVYLDEDGNELHSLLFDNGTLMFVFSNGLKIQFEP
ncbi:hypothetical protein GCM10023331_13210 [Algivirga pacifica]|uniref:Beta-lactamase-inhibitor-like PepSY-like domain-containing protein n=2 Tax=Algivirga pacifica TaxID=1162670 RepID=A0ABP9D4P8_9BACT